jgi:hypothetical protein
VPSIEELQIIVDASTEVLRAELSKANAGIDKFERNVNTSMGKVNSSFEGLSRVAGIARNAVAGFVAGVGVGLLQGGAKAILDYADDLGTAADQANIAVERYQTLREAFRALEVDGEQFNKILQKLIQAQGDVANGAKNGATKALDELGVSADIVSGKIQTTDQLLDAIAASFGRIEDPARKAALAGDLVGSRLGVQFAAAIRDGGAALKELEQAMRDSGTVIDEDFIQTLADANEEWDRFVASVQQKSVILAGSFVKAMRGFAELYRQGGISAVGNASFDDARAALSDKKIAELEAAGERYRAAKTSLARINDSTIKATPEAIKKRTAELKAEISAAEAILKSYGLLPDAPTKPSPRASDSDKTGGKGKATKPEPTPAELRLGDGSIPPELVQQGPLIDTPVMQDNAEFWRTITGLIGDAAKETGNLKISLKETFNEQLKEDMAAIEEYGLRGLSGGLADVIFYGEDAGDVLENSFKRAAAAMLEAAIQAKVLGPLLEGLKGNGGGGGFFSSIGTAISSFFGGARASGGPVQAGKMYMVGERGPEPFIPRLNGDIISNENMRRMMGGGGGGGSPLTVNVDARGATDPAMVAAAARRAVYEAAPAIIRMSAKTTMDGFSRPSLQGGWG